MQFVSDGPDVPDEVLQAHEEGRVVFFCGAGISYPAGLPGFKGLVDEIYKYNGTSASDIEKAALDRGQYDAALDLLERRLPGQRIAVRLALKHALKPNLRRKGARDTHSALLNLARNRDDGALRLVTTNFDRIFHSAANYSGQKFQEYAAPTLPIAKNSRWDGLVFLHGLLPYKSDEFALNRLVVTSGDFGLAYLTERWAARFVSELFRNYVVCFVGYSINDPVLRYMMDALAADRMLGEDIPQAWAFGDYKPGEEQLKETEWKAKGVTPILYKVPEGNHDHSAMHKTLNAWADIYRDGVLGKERIVINHALARPSASTQQDDFVSRMLWALSHKSGLPAKRFAEFNPAPSLDWLLEVFSDERFGHNDLVRFGVPPKNEFDEKLRFSLINRPCPYSHAPQMSLTSGSIDSSSWDSVMSNLAKWLARHLGDLRLVLMIARHGGQLNGRLSQVIRNRLDYIIGLESKDDFKKLDEIRLHAPNAIPSHLVHTLWRLILSGRLKSTSSELDLYGWIDRFKRDGLTTTNRFEFRILLAPKVVLRKRFLPEGKNRNSTEEEAMSELVDWEIGLATDNAHSALSGLSGERWAAALPELFDELQMLLRDALDLLAEMGGASERYDISYWHLPSISPHWQNRGYNDWVILIELLRDAWSAIRKLNIARATEIAHFWFDLPYPTFKRLALYAASQDDSAEQSDWVKWLLADNAWWLWSNDTKREVLRLFVSQGNRLAAGPKRRLEEAILAGPPRAKYRDDIEPDHLKNIVEHSTWLYLAKLNTTSIKLGSLARKRLNELSKAHPKWKLEENESDEFSTWMSGTGDPDYEESRIIDIAPRTRAELFEWLKRPTKKNTSFDEDTWDDVCRTRFFHSLHALCELANENVWPTNRWSSAMYIWSQDGMAKRSWKFAAPLLLTMPEPQLSKITHSVSSWLRAASESIDRHEEIFLSLSKRILSLPDQTDKGALKNDNPVSDAINHPVGHITEALLNNWLKSNPNDNEKLPCNIEPTLTSICNTDTEQFRHGRVILASRLITLFRVDRAWTERNILPLLKWDNPFEARAAWEGFLWSPRLYQPLLIAIKDSLIESAAHYDELGEHKRQYAAFLTYAALAPIEGFTVEEFRSVIETLPQDGLEVSAQSLTQALKGASPDQKENYWNKHVQPFWQHIWPKSRDLATTQISQSLTQLSIAADSKFPEALSAVNGWLQPFENLGYPIKLLHESNLCEDYPEESLSLLDLIIRDQRWPPPDMKNCLDQIIKSSPQLKFDQKYLRLLEYWHRQSAKY